jgi:hypothetical protein
MSTKFILTLLTISLSLSASMVIIDANGNTILNDNSSKLVICKDGAGCLSFAQILTNKCLEANCHNQEIFTIHTFQ